MRAMSTAICATLVLALTGCCVTNFNQNCPNVITAVYCKPGTTPGSAGELGRANIAPGQTVQSTFPPGTTQVQSFLINGGTTSGPFGPFATGVAPNCSPLVITCGIRKGKQTPSNAAGKALEDCPACGSSK